MGDRALEVFQDVAGSLIQLVGRLAGRVGRQPIDSKITPSTDSKITPSTDPLSALAADHVFQKKEASRSSGSPPTKGARVKMANVANTVSTKARLITAATAIGAMLLMGTGTALAADITCVSFDLYCYGTSGDDVMKGANTGQKMYGSLGSDRIEGYGGDDFIDGGADNDLLLGGSGNDTLVGGPGADNFYGDYGDDTIDADDGVKDGNINCGPGYDRVKVDAYDVLGASCEVKVRDHRS